MQFLMALFLLGPYVHVPDKLLRVYTQNNYINTQ